MKKIDLSWVIVILLAVFVLTYNNDSVISRFNNDNNDNNVEINGSYSSDSIISYSSNNEAEKTQNNNYLTGSDLEFDSNYYIYYSYLSENGKKIYKQVYANAIAYNKTFKTVVKIKVNELSDVMEAVFNDHPELFYLDTNYAYKYNGLGMCIEITLNYNDTIKNINQNKELFENEVNKIVNEANKLPTDYDKEKYVYMALINKVDYDKTALYNQSAYSALVMNKSVCAGYTRAFQLIMQKLRIPTYFVLGYAKEDHAWNIVKLNGEYYNVDLTWDDTGGVFKHFNLTDKEISDTHKRNSISVNLPRCNYYTYRY